MLKSNFYLKKMASYWRRRNEKRNVVKSNCASCSKNDTLLATKPRIISSQIMMMQKELSYLRFEYVFEKKQLHSRSK